MDKKWWASKTLWVNVVAGASAFAGIFNIEGLDPETQTALVGGIMAVANIVLRITTKGALTK
jgi:hypothetical protein